MPVEFQKVPTIHAPNFMLIGDSIVFVHGMVRRVIAYWSVIKIFSFRFVLLSLAIVIQCITIESKNRPGQIYIFANMQSGFSV